MIKCTFKIVLNILGEQNGYNIPEVYEANEVSKWFSSAGAGYEIESHPPNSMSSSGSIHNKDLGDLSKRLVCDAYMAFYKSEDVMMYQ